MTHASPAQGRYVVRDRVKTGSGDDMMCLCMQRGGGGSMTLDRGWQNSSG